MVPAFHETISKSLVQLYLSAEAVYSCNDRDNFFRVMDELKKSEIAIDNETLEMIRTFM